MFSQNQEEKHILEYFKYKSSQATNPTPPQWVIDGRPPAFLSIGENDGITFSNVRALALNGWCGVMVEPSPKAYERLKELYNGHKCFYTYPYAITTSNGKKDFHESGSLCSPSDVGLVSTFHSSEMDRFKRTVSYAPIEVKTFRWKTFLNRLTIKKFNFISIDAEGEDLNILAQLDLNALETSCICLEWNSKPDLKKEYDYYLKEFRIIYTSGENLIYAR